MNDEQPSGNPWLKGLLVVGVAAVAVQMWGTTQPWRGDTVAFDARQPVFD